MRILVVDDERGVRDSLRRALGLEGYQVELAADGQEALERLSHGAEPDAIILDVAMPRLGGIEACQLLRRGGSQVPVLMLTASGARETRDAALDAGATAYLAKPFALEELLAIVRNLVTTWLLVPALATAWPLAPL